MWFMRGCTVALAVSTLWVALTGYAITASVWAGFVAALVLPDLLKPTSGLYRWSSAITDRRLIYRAGDGSCHIAAPLAEFEIVEEREPEKILADTSEKARKIVALLGKPRIRDGKACSIGIRHGERYFPFETGILQNRRLRELITRAKEGTG